MFKVPKSINVSAYFYRAHLVKLLNHIKIILNVLFLKYLTAVLWRISNIHNNFNLAFSLPSLTHYHLNTTCVNCKSNSDVAEQLSPGTDELALITSSLQISLVIRSSVWFAIFPIYSYLNGLQGIRPNSFSNGNVWG